MVLDPKPGDVVTVDVKSAWASKINWTQAVAVAAAGLSYFGLNLDAPTQAALLMVITGAQGVATWIIKTWFTNSVTPAAVAK